MDNIIEQIKTEFWEQINPEIVDTTLLANVKVYFRQERIAGTFKTETKYIIRYEANGQEDCVMETDITELLKEVKEDLIKKIPAKLCESEIL